MCIYKFIGTFEIQDLRQEGLVFYLLKMTLNVLHLIFFNIFVLKYRKQTNVCSNLILVTPEVKFNFIEKNPKIILERK